MTHRCWPYPGEPCFACEAERPLTRRERLTLAAVGMLGAAGFFGFLTLLFLAGAG